MCVRFWIFVRPHPFGLEQNMCVRFWTFVRPHHLFTKENVPKSYFGHTLEYVPLPLPINICYALNHVCLFLITNEREIFSGFVDSQPLKKIRYKKNYLLQINEIIHFMYINSMGKEGAKIF